MSRTEAWRQSAQNHQADELEMEVASFTQKQFDYLLNWRPIKTVQVIQTNPRCDLDLKTLRVMEGE
jgi:isocitrate/isopropylmalate dehydrogenase